jgi:hypothetical protein
MFNEEGNTAQKRFKGKKTRWIIQQIDAWRDGDNWIWNNAFNIGVFYSDAKDMKTAFREKLRNMGVSFALPTEVLYDGSIYELIIKQTGEPMFALVCADEH